MDENTDNSKQQYAFIQHRTMLKIIQFRFGSERLYLAESKKKSSVYMGLSCLILRLSWPYIEQFNQLTIRLFSSGFYQLWLDDEYHYEQMKYFTRNHQHRQQQQQQQNTNSKTIDSIDKIFSSSSSSMHSKNSNSNDQFESIAFSHVIIIFYLYFSLIFISFSIFLIELIYFELILTKSNKCHPN